MRINSATHAAADCRGNSLSAFTLGQLARALGRPLSEAEGLRLEAAACALNKRIARLEPVGAIH